MEGWQIKEPYKCPVCNGQGTVDKPPWIADDQDFWTGTGTGVYPCKNCQGTGIIR